MRVLQVIDQLNVGGAERVLVDLTNLLVRNGGKVEVLTLVRPGSLSEDLAEGVRLINLDRRNKLNLLKLWRAHVICAKYDIVHVHLRYNFKYLALAKFLFRGQYEMILHDHFGDIENDKSIPFGLRWFLRRNRWFIGVSQPLVEWAVEVIGLPRKQTFLLPNIALKADITKDVDLHSDYVRVIHISNFRASKNHIFAFKLFAKLKESMKIKVSFIGQVIDASYMMQMVQAVKECGISDSIEFIHDCHNVQAIMHRFDLAIHSAYQESGPLVLIEYLAQKVPFVAYKTGEVSTQIQSLIPEFFLETFDISQWVDRIKFVLEKRSDLVQKMDGAFKSLYSDNAYVEKCLIVYKQVQNG